jgi:hypothetical protein
MKHATRVEHDDFTAAHESNESRKLHEKTHLTYSPARLKVRQDGIVGLCLKLQGTKCNCFGECNDEAGGGDAASRRGEECVCNIKNLSLVKFVPKNDKKVQI